MGWRSRRRRRQGREESTLRWTVVGSLAAVAGVIAAVIAIVFGDSGSDSTAEPADSWVRAAVEVRNGPTQARQDARGALQYTNATQPTIYLNLRNDGSRGT